MDQAAQQARAAALGQTGLLNIGLNYSAPFSPHVSAIFRRFSRHYPQVQLELFENTSAKQLDRLHRHELDLCFTWQSQDDVSPYIDLLPLGNDTLYLGVTAHTPLGKKTKLHITDLKDQTIFLTLRQSRTVFYERLMVACHTAGFEPRVRTDIIQLPFIMTMVAAGQGVAFLPGFFEKVRPTGTLFRPCTFLPKGQSSMPFTLTSRKNDPSPVVRHFLTEVRNYLNKA